MYTKVNQICEVTMFNFLENVDGMLFTEENGNNRMN